MTQFAPSSCHKKAESLTGCLNLLILCAQPTLWGLSTVCILGPARPERLAGCQNLMTSRILQLLQLSKLDRLPIHLSICISIHTCMCACIRTVQTYTSTSTSVCVRACDVYHALCRAQLKKMLPSLRASCRKKTI